jgi:hypothetical protein
MDDNDVAKCREGRLDYGKIATVIIVLPLSLFLLNDIIGDAVMDTLLPAFYSGLIIVGDTIIAINIALLIVPIALIIAVALFVVFIYRPAQIAVSKRLLLKRDYWAARLALTSRRTSTGNNYGRFGENFKRLLAASVRVLKVSCIYLQDVLVRKLSYIRKQQLNSELFIWQNMNVSPYAQGYHNYPDDIADSNTDTDSLFTSESGSHKGRGKFKPPMEIARMLHSNILKEFYLNDNCVVKNKDLADILKDTRPMIFKSAARLNIKDGYKPEPPIIFEFVEALSLIRTRLSTKLSGNISFVSVIDLSKEVETIWDRFYPQGVIMSVAERKECVELFDIWSSKEELYYKDIVVDNVLITMKVVSFTLFQDWFLNDLSTKVLIKKTDRLLTHVLRTPQPITSAKATNSSRSSYKTREVRMNTLTSLNSGPSTRSSFKTRRTSMNTLISLNPGNFNSVAYPSEQRVNTYKNRDKNSSQRMSSVNRNDSSEDTKESGDDDDDEDVYVDNLEQRGFLSFDIQKFVFSENPSQNFKKPNVN